MASFEEIQQICNDHINKQSFFAQPEELYQGVTHIIAQKGKRIRPTMLLMACDLFGGDLDNALNPAFGVELFHNSTLVHDDIMDESDLRRGKPTVHNLYGLNNAILSGDVMMYYSYQYLFKTDKSKIADVAQMFTTAAIQVFEGQQMDLNFENRMNVSEEEYLKMIEYKTAVLIAISLKLGALIGGAERNDQDAIYEFGRNLGLAFQLKDDNLDVFIVALIILNMKFDSLFINTQLKIGTTYFAISLVLMMISSFILRRKIMETIYSSKILNTEEN